MDELTLRTGFEVELLAPAGSDRQVLADELAARLGGQVRRSFHTDSEPSVVPGVGVFRHLSPAFDVVDADGRPVARLVDDITIEADLTPGGPGRQGWYRVLSDDARLLRLVERHADPDAPLATVLEPVAELFGVRVESSAARPGSTTPPGATVAVAMPLPSGRERPCEIITPPLDADHTAALERLLVPARELGFTVPQEAAVHLHVDGAPFRRPEAFANVVRLFGHWRQVLWAALGTNPACRRLAPLPDALLDLVETERRRYARAGHRPDQVRRREPHAAGHAHVRCGTRSRCGSCPARSTDRASCGGRPGRGSARPLPRPAPAAPARRGRHAGRPARGPVPGDGGAGGAVAPDAAESRERR